MANLGQPVTDRPVAGRTDHGVGQVRQAGSAGLPNRRIAGSPDRAIRPTGAGRDRPISAGPRSGYYVSLLFYGRFPII